MIFACFLPILFVSSAWCTAINSFTSLQPKVQSLADAIKLVEETHGCCSSKEISEFIHVPELFNGTKFVLDLDLFEYLAEQTEPQPIVALSKNLASALLTFFSKSPILVENRAVCKLFLNFELMAERLLLMKSKIKNTQEDESIKLQVEYFGYLEKIALSKGICQRKIENCDNPFLFRFSLEVSQLTICRSVREYSKGCGNAVFQNAFPFDPIIQEYVIDIWENLQDISVERSSSEQKLLAYLQLGDILIDAVGKDFIALPFLIWLCSLSSELFALPEYYQEHTYKLISESSPNFLLSYVETAFPENMLLKYFSKVAATLNIDSIKQHLNGLPTLRLKYLFLKSTFLGLFQPSSFLSTLSVGQLQDWVKKALGFEVYGANECYILHFLFGTEAEHLIVLEVLKLPNGEKEHLKNIRRVMREAMPSKLKEFLAIPQVSNLLFIHSEHVQSSLLVTFDTIRPVKSKFLEMRMDLDKNDDHQFPPYKQKLIKNKKSNQLDLEYLMTVAKATYSMFLGRLKGKEDSSSIFPFSVDFINGRLPSICLFKETLPASCCVSSNVDLQNRLFFIIYSIAFYVERNKSKLAVDLIPEKKITDPIDVLMYLEEFENISHKEHEDAWKLIKTLPHNPNLPSNGSQNLQPVKSDYHQQTLNAYIVLLELNSINSNIVLHKYISEYNEPELRTPKDSWNNAIQQLLVLLKKQYNSPAGCHQKEILSFLRVLYNEVKEDAYWAHTQKLMMIIQELVIEVALLKFTNEGFSEMVDTLDINLSDVMKPARKLPLVRRMALMECPLFTIEFKTFLIQNVCINAVHCNHSVKDEQHQSKGFIHASKSQIAVLSFVLQGMCDYTYKISKDPLTSLYSKLMNYFTKAKATRKYNTKVSNLFDEALPGLEICLKCDSASKEVLEFVASALAFRSETRKLPVVTSFKDHGGINTKPRIGLLKWRKKTPSWRLKNNVIFSQTGLDGENDDLKEEVLSLLMNHFGGAVSINMNETGAIAKLTTSNSSSSKVSRKFQSRSLKRVKKDDDDDKSSMPVVQPQTIKEKEANSLTQIQLTQRTEEIVEEQSLDDAIKIVEETRGCCSTRKISKHMNNTEFFKGTKFVFDLDLFDYLADQIEPPPIVNLAENLTSALITQFAKSPVLVENSALVKLFLNFELIVERLLMMKAKYFKLSANDEMKKLKTEYAEFVRIIASFKIVCQKVIESCPHQYLFREGLEVSNMTISHDVRIYSFRNKNIQKAFSPDDVIQEYLDDMLIFRHFTSVEDSSSGRRLLTYLRFGDMMMEALGENYFTESCSFWLSSLLNELSTFPNVFQIQIFKDLLETSPRFLLAYVETAFSEEMLVSYFNRPVKSFQCLLDELKDLPTLRLMYLCLKGSSPFSIFLPLISSVPSENLRNLLKEAISFEVYMLKHCCIRRFLFSSDETARLRISLGTLKLSDEEKEQLKKFGETVRKEMPSDLRKFLAVIEVYNLIFIYSDDIERALLVTYENMKALKDEFSNIKKENLANDNYTKELIEGKESNQFNFDYIKKVSLATFSYYWRHLNGMKTEDTSIFPFSITFISKGKKEITLFKETLPNLANKDYFQSRLLFVILGMAEYVARKGIWEREKTDIYLSPELEITDPVELLDHLFKSDHYSQKEQEDSWALISKLPNADQHQLVLHAYTVLLESKNINPYSLNKYISENIESNSQTTKNLLNNAIQELLVLLRKQYSIPNKKREDGILNRLSILYHETTDDDAYWKRTQKLMKFIQDLSVEVALLSFSPEGLSNLIDTLSIELYDIVNVIRKLPLSRRKELMDSPLFTLEFKTVLTQKAYLNVTDEAKKIDKHLDSQIYTLINGSRFALISFLDPEHVKNLIHVPRSCLGSKTKILKFCRSFLATGNIIWNIPSKEHSKEDSERFDLYFEGLDIVFIRGIASIEVIEYISSRLFYSIEATKIRRVIYRPNLINITPHLDLIKKRQASPSWLLLNSDKEKEKIVDKYKGNAGLEYLSTVAVDSSSSKRAEAKKLSNNLVVNNKKEKNVTEIPKVTDATPVLPQLSEDVKQETPMSLNATDAQSRVEKVIEEEPTRPKEDSSMPVRPSVVLRKVRRGKRSNIAANLTQPKTEDNSSGNPLSSSQPKKDDCESINRESKSRTEPNKSAEIQPIEKEEVTTECDRGIESSIPEVRPQNASNAASDVSSTKIGAVEGLNSPKQLVDLATHWKAKERKTHSSFKVNYPEANSSKRKKKADKVVRTQRTNANSSRLRPSKLIDTPRQTPISETDDLKASSVSVPKDASKSQSDTGIQKYGVIQPIAPPTSPVMKPPHTWPINRWQDLLMFTPSQSSLFSFSPQQKFSENYFSPNPSLNSEIFTLDKSNAEDLDVLLLLLQHATSVAIDFEMTGVGNGQSTVEGVKEHKVFQMGLCIVKNKDGQEFISTWRINACENGVLEEQMFNVESLEFLKKSLGQSFVEDMRPKLLDYSPLRAIFKEIQARNVPVIVHNGYADLLHVSKIMGEDITSMTFDTFRPLFLIIYDTKYLYEELNNLYKRKSMTNSVLWNTALGKCMTALYPSVSKSEVMKMHDGAYDALATYLVYSAIIKRFEALQTDYQALPRKLFKMYFF